MSSIAPLFRKLRLSVAVKALPLSLLLLLLMAALGCQSRQRTLFSVDQAPTLYSSIHQSLVLSSFVGKWDRDSLGMGYGGEPFLPTRVLGVFLEPMQYHVGTYMLDCLLLCLAARWYLSGKRVRGIPAWLAAVAMGLSGYAFSLISAGHRGQFHMMPYAVFLLASIDRAIARRSMLYFVLAGLCLGFGMAGQPDVMALFAILAAVFSAFRLVEECRRGSSSKERRRLLARTALGGVLTGLVFACVSLGVFGSLFRTALPHRETLRGNTPQQQWEYCTNWSMPPEEILEFVAPCVYGIETQDKAGPYWGRLGRAMDWGATGQGLVNLKQHTVYMGVLQLVFAVFAVAVAVRSRHFAADDLNDGPTAPVLSRGLSRGEVFFWAGVFLLTVLLALGRYFPLYRLVFMVPYLNKIRCPVKWLHLAEVALAFLFAFGLTAFFSMLSRRGGVQANADTQQKATRAASSMLLWAAVMCGLIGILLFGVAGSVPMFRGALIGYWGRLGLGGNSAVMLKTMVGALRHGGTLFLIACAGFVIAIRYRERRWCAPLLKGCLVVVVACDLALVARRYINTRDVRVFYDRNAVAERILADTEMGRVSDRLTTRGKFDPRWTSLRNNGVDFLEPMQREVPLPPEYGKFFKTAGKNVARLWQITNTRYVLGPVDSLQGLLDHSAFAPVLFFDVIGGRLIPAQQGRARNVLVRFAGALPRALVYHNWLKMDEEKALSMLASPEWAPERTLLVSDDVDSRPTQRPPSPAEIVSYGRTRIEVKVELDQAGVLLVNDKYDPDWRVKIDGTPAEVLRCNYIMRGVEVPAGQHTVVFTYRPFLIPFLLSLGVTLAILVWAVVRLLRGRR